MPDRIIFLFPEPDLLAGAVASQLAVVAKTVSGRWAEPYVVVHRRAVFDVGDTDLGLIRALDWTDDFERHWLETQAQAETLDRPNILSDRLDFLDDALTLTGADAIVIPNASLTQVEMLWDFVITRPLSRLPLLFCHITRLSGRWSERKKTLPPSARIDLLRQRFESLDLFSKRLFLSASSPPLIQFLGGSGLPVAPVSHFNPKSDRPLVGAPPRVGLCWPSAESGLRRAIDLFHQEALDVGLTAALTLLLPEKARSHLLRRPEVLGFRGGTVSIRPLEREVVGAGGFDLLVVADPLLPLALNWMEREAPAIIVVSDGEGVVGLPVAADLEAAVGAAIDWLQKPGQTPSPPDLARHLVASAERTETPTPKPLVLHVATAWGGEGSSHVFAAQLHYLHSRGYATFCLHLATHNLNTSHAELELAATLPANGAIHRWLITREKALVDPEMADGLLQPYSIPHLSLEGENRIGRQAKIPGSLRRVMASNRPAFVLLNYGHLHRFVTELGLNDLPILLETHDVRAKQHAIYNKGEMDTFEATLELDYYSRADGVVFINKREELDFSKRYPGIATTVAHPFLAAPDDGAPIDSVQTPVSDILGLGSVAHRLTGSMIERLLSREVNGAGGFALFVGSGHEANCVSLQWFLEEVFLPHLSREGVTLLVAGAIKDHFKDFQVPGVIFLGRVDRLKTYYDLADLVVLPIREGTGLPIKTIDAIIYRRPFVATTGALRAIPEILDVFPAHDDPESFATALLKLISDPDERQRFLEKIDQFRLDYANWDRYAGVWDELLKATFGQAPVPLPGWNREMVRSGISDTPQWGPPSYLSSGKHYFFLKNGLESHTHFSLDQQYKLNLVDDYGRLALCYHYEGDRQGDVSLSLMVRSTAAHSYRLRLFLDGRDLGTVRIPTDQDQPLHLPMETPPVEGRVQTILEFWLPRRAEDPLLAPDKPRLRLEQLYVQY